MHRAASVHRPDAWRLRMTPGFLLLLFAIVAVSGCGSTQPARVQVVNPPVPPSELQTGFRRILQVEDGNTVILASGHRVRLLGSCAPEIGHLELPVQHFGREAAEYLKNIAVGRNCTLKYDGSCFYDNRGRLLAYVYVNGRMLNEELIRNGYAFVSLDYPFSHETRFMEIEREARARQLGLWNLSLRDGRIANLVSRFDALNRDGRMKLDSFLEELVLKYPAKTRPATGTAVRVTTPAVHKPLLREPAPVIAEPPKPVLSADAVPWAEAAKYYGRKAVIEGEVAATYRSEAVCFLNFNADYSRDFFAVIHASAFQQFPPNPEAFYKGRRVRVTGIVREFKGRPQIILESPTQIEILE